MHFSVVFGAAPIFTPRFSNKSALPDLLVILRLPCLATVTSAALTIRADSVETLKLLEGIFDIYMPDVKFFDNQLAKSTCNSDDYSIIVKKALNEMHRQVGDLQIDKNGIAVKGLLVRHLVMPNYVND